ncbi:hypothetical protein FA13DRAFT_1731103 [Coprinellus micaceus]|uniref:SUZ domain-containing protein n=1 Tax=Coprinellus micaceus TaxID=71717 RepID=A0A4Y7TEL4_COPMI|nr:hypothetical protein FA13DRAFT_1731103 [Coprinellus micaceus]
MNASRLPQKTSRASAPAVKDDWDDDEDSEEEAPTEERNKQIWEDANTKMQHPMPDVVLVRNTAAPLPSAHIPPQGVFDQLPKMKILKRPTQSSPSPVPSSASAESAQDSLKEREARYKAARERIFGSESPSNSTPNVTSPESPNLPQQQVKVAREPRGPSNSSNAFAARGGGEAQSKGFRNRNAKPQVADDIDDTQ